MTTITSLFSRLVLALTLVTGAGAAMAVPATYHVTLDTSSFSGDGYLDLGFGGVIGSTGTAVVSNVTGAVTNATSIIGVVNGDLTSTAAFNGADFGDLAQLVHLGGMFGFDILFDIPDTGAGLTFSMSLLDMDFGSLVGTDFLAQIELTPGAGASLTTFSPLATVTAITADVPEPGQWILMLSGLLLMGAMVRRRNM